MFLMIIDCSNKATIEWLYEKMVRAAIAKARSIVRRDDIAAEIAHDTFIKLWQHGSRFPNEKAVYAWIYKTCHRAAIDHLRSAAYRREDYDREGEAEIGVPASSVESAMTREIIQKYVMTLPPQEAEAFLYVTLDGMTQVEIAEIMGLSRRTVQRLLDRVDEHFQELRSHGGR